MNLHRSAVITIAVFLALVTPLYFLGYWLIYRLGSATPLMLTVGLAAILTCLITGKPIRSLGWSWGHWKYQSLSYLLPLGYVAAAYLLIWALGLGGWYDTGFVSGLKDDYNLESWSDPALLVLHFVLTASISFLLLLPSVLGEELGWRGLLVPELSRIMPFSGVALFSGLLWAGWHWPLMFLGLYGNEGTPFVYQLSCLTVCLISMSVVMAYIRLKSHSLWPAVVFHMSHNVFLQKFFGPATSENPDSAWFVGEFGAVVPLMAVFLAVTFWRKGQREFGSPRSE